MTTKRAPKELGPFSTAFLDQLDKIEEEGRALGLNMTIICRLAKVSRAGPVRWRRNVPATVKLMDQMYRVVQKARLRAENRDR